VDHYELLKRPLAREALVRLHAARCRWRSRAANWILGRFACLGRDVLALTETRLPVVNVQKGRVDQLLAWWANPNLRPRTREVAPHMRTNLPLIAQEENLGWWRSARPPAFVFIDSFAELTDQVFFRRSQGWRFCCGYSDLTHTQGFSERFSCGGLLAEEAFHSAYERFFSVLRHRFGRVPIIFLHFPKALEGRESFRRRAVGIREAVEALAPRFEPFCSLSVDEAMVDWPEDATPEDRQGLPYHYNQSTYRTFARLVRESALFPTSVSKRSPA
jgi:hypothetical protein